MFELSNVGATAKGRAFDLRTRGGAYAGLLVETYGKGVKVYFNSNATRGSARVFSDLQAAVAYVFERRVKKGWGV